MVSTGNMGMARTILDGLILNGQKKKEVTTPLSVTTYQLKKALESKGYIVEEQIGQSSFKCSLAVKKKLDDINYCLGILIDDDLHYRNDDLVEQYYQRPSVLQSFGWQIINVFAKDWLEDSARVMNSLINFLEEGPDFKEPAASGNQVLNETHEQNESAFKFITLSAADGQRFWEIAQSNDQLHIRFGKTGSKGQTLIKTLASNEEAAFAKEKLIEEQINLGFKRD